MRNDNMRWYAICKGFVDDWRVAEYLIFGVLSLNNMDLSEKKKSGDPMDCSGFAVYRSTYY